MALLCVSIVLYKISLDILYNTIFNFKDINNVLKIEVIFMSNTEFIGYLAVYGIVFIGGLIGLIAPIVKLNVNIQKLTDSITHLTSDSKKIEADVNKHETILNDHETRLTVIEKSQN